MALVTGSDIKAIAVKNAQFDEGLITTYAIEQAEETHILPFLGADLFADLLINPTATYNAQLLAGCDYTNTSGYQRKFRGLKRAIAYFTMFDILPEIYSQIGSAGLFKNSVQFATSVTLEECNNLRGLMYSKAQKSMEKVMEYLINNSVNFPLFNSITSGDDVFNNNFNPRKKLLGGMLL